VIVVPFDSHLKEGKDTSMVLVEAFEKHGIVK